MSPESDLSPSRDGVNPRSVYLLALLVMLFPALLYYFVLPALPRLGTIPNPIVIHRDFPNSELRFSRQAIGTVREDLPLVCNVKITNLVPNGPMGVLICDASQNRVSFCSRSDSETWTETILGTDLIAPAHATPVDIDQDSDIDILVSVMGNIEPDDGVIGKLVLLERDGDHFHPKTILDDVRRVADAQPGDFDGDGDIDIAVAVFGYNRGQVLWLEAIDSGEFRTHELLSAPGTIHVPVADFDSDGDLDIAAIVTQDEEELWGFENLGSGNFEKHRLWMTHNFDLGSAGLIADDLDGDGDIDFILPAGDNLEDFDPFPQPYHGCLWFENKGHWEFVPHRIANFGGTYAAAVADLDADGDRDVVLVSMANDWHDPTRASIVWLENDGNQDFTPWRIDSNPTHLVTVSTGDLNDDGLPDIVGGGLHIRGPYDRLGRVTAWFSNKDAEP